MQTTTTETPIVQKTRELCELIIAQPEFKDIRKRLDSFMADQTAQAQYQSLSEKGRYLQHKQQQGAQLNDAEIAGFEKEREAFFKNPVGKGFIDAQEEMHEMQESVSQYLTKTFELGRVPAAEDMEDGSCGHGCGCGHGH